MPIPVLIAYATRSGSTLEVAEAIGAALEDAGAAATVLPVAQVSTLSDYTSVILGGPLYIGRFPKEFRNFIRSQREGLERCQPWCFVLGPTRNETKDFDAARTQALKQLSRYPWLHPVELKVFGGRWSMASVPFPFSLVRRIPGNPLGKIPAQDIRDWGAIREWAQGIARQLEPAAQECHPTPVG